MAKLYTFFDEYILSNIFLIRLILKGEYNQQLIYLGNLIKILETHHNFIENQYQLFEKFKKDIAQKKSKQSELLENIKNPNKPYIYAEVPEELQEFIGNYINSKKDLEKIESEFNYLIDIISNSITQANYIEIIIYRFRDNIFRRKTKNTSYRNFTELEKYLSNLSLKVKFNFQFKPQINELKKIIKEIDKIYKILNELLSLEQNGGKFEISTDIIKYLVDLFDITTIKKITVNSKCKIVITIDEQDYFIQDIIRICKKLESKVARIFDKAQTFIPLINSYFDDETFIKTCTQIYSTKQGCSISKLKEISSNYFNNINYKLNLVALSVLGNNIKALQDDTDYQYFCFIYDKIKIILQNHQNYYILDFDDIKALIEIFGASIKGIGLDGFGKYILYYNYDKSQFTTFEEFIKKLTTVQNKLKKCIPTTKLLLETGKQCFECPGFFNVLKQSCLKKSEEINIVINEYYQKLEQAELSSEASSTELEQKQSTIKSIYNELKTIQKYAKFVNDTVYKTDSQHNYTFFNENYIQPAENILKFYQNADEIMLKNNGNGEIRLFFVFCNQKKSYYTIRHEYSCLNQSLERLQEQAKSTYDSNKNIVQKKEEQKSVLEKCKLENKLLYIKWLWFSAFGSIFLFGLMYIFNGLHVYNTKNRNQAENMVLKLNDIGEAKNIDDIKKIQQTYEQASFILKKNKLYVDELKYNHYQYKINQAKEKLKDEYEAIDELQRANKLATSGMNLITNKSYSLEKWEQAKSNIYSAKKLLLAMSTYTFVESQRYQKLQEYNYYYSLISARIVTEAADSELLIKVQNIIEEVSKIIESSPHASETWKKAESMLVEVIPDLKDTSKDSSKRAELQKQLKRCEKFYVIVSKQVKIVEEFESTYNYGYNISQEAIGILEKSPDNFSKLRNILQQIESAISSLQTIPSNTSNYKQAQELIVTLKSNQESIITHMKTIQSCNQVPDNYCGYENLDLRTPPSLN